MWPCVVTACRTCRHAVEEGKTCAGARAGMGVDRQNGQQGASAGGAEGSSESSLERTTRVKPPLPWQRMTVSTSPAGMRCTSASGDSREDARATSSHARMAVWNLDGRLRKSMNGLLLALTVSVCDYVSVCQRYAGGAGFSCN